MSLLEALDKGWNLFCGRAADFWECGDHLAPNFSLMGLLRWDAEEDEEPEETLERLCLSRERGDLVVKALPFPPAPVWVAATRLLMEHLELPLALLRQEAKDDLLIFRTEEGDKALNRALSGPPRSRPWTRRCCLCPYSDICQIVYPTFIEEVSL